MVMFSGLPVRETTLFFAVFGQKADPEVDGFPRRVDHHRLAVDLNHPGGGFAHPEDQLRQFGTPGADQPGEADDFAGMHHRCWA